MIRALEIKKKDQKMKYKKKENKQNVKITQFIKVVKAEAPFEIFVLKQGKHLFDNL